MDILLLYQFCRQGLHFYIHESSNCILVEHQTIRFLDFVTGLLPWEAGQVVYGQCALRIHDCMEDGLPFHWQKHQEKGLFLLFENIFLLNFCHKKHLTTLVFFFWSGTLVFSNIVINSHQIADCFCGEEQSGSNPTPRYWPESTAYYIRRSTKVSSDSGVLRLLLSQYYVYKRTLYSIGSIIYCFSYTATFLKIHALPHQMRFEPQKVILGYLSE